MGARPSWGKRTKRRRRAHEHQRPCGEAPYTGANRIRFEGCFSACRRDAKHPRFKPPLNHVFRAIVHDRGLVLSDRVPIEAAVDARSKQIL
jgi:hypothetical protein